MLGIIDVPALRRAADLLPTTLDEKDRSIEVVWSTGARVRRQPFFGEPFDEELSMDPAEVHLDRLNAGAPLLKVHDRFALEAVIGSVVPGTARIENGRGLARVRFSERDDVTPVWNDIRSGHIRAVSVGYQVQRYEITRPNSGPELWRAVDWTPFEISAVPVGADPAAGFRSVDCLMPCVLDRDDATTPRRNIMENAQAKPATPDPNAAGDLALPGILDHKEEGLEQRSRADARPSKPAQVAAETVAPTPAAPTAEVLVARAQEIERDRVSTIDRKSVV